MKKKLLIPGLWNSMMAIVISLIGLSSNLSAQNIIPFDTAHWDLSAAQITTHEGQNALVGAAMVKDVVFENGIIEVDINAKERVRSYPGIVFREQGNGSNERVYLRPHRSPYYEDVVQYAPSFNGVDSWQLYNGAGKSATADIIPNTWEHLKIIVVGNKASVYLNDDAQPVLEITDLKHGTSKGAIGLSSPVTGAAYYANFSYTPIDTMISPDAINEDRMPGMVTSWELSNPFPLAKADFNHYPTSDFQASRSWQPVTPDGSGLVDISQYYPRASRAGDAILAKTTITVDQDTLMRMGIGYSDYITVYLNQTPLFFGNSAYRSRDKSFLGIVGYNDNLFLPLKKGANELMVQVGETMGGWAFACRDENAVYLAPGIAKQWEIKGPVAMPEAVAYDPEKEVCYVSNYFNEGKEYISKVSSAGEMLDSAWVDGMVMPTGLCVSGDVLYVVDRTGLHRINTQTGEKIDKIALPGLLVPNDVTMDAEGVLYISDTRGNSLYRYVDGTLEQWLGPDVLSGPNGLLADGNHLLIGQNESLLMVDTQNKENRIELATFDGGSNIDGVQPEKPGIYLVSDFNGKLYRVTTSGEKTLLINTSVPGDWTADFAYDPDTKMIIIPTVYANTLIGYSMP